MRGCQIPPAIELWMQMVFIGICKILFVSGDASIDGEYVVFLSIVIMDLYGDSLTISRLTVLDHPFVNTILSI